MKKCASQFTMEFYLEQFPRDPDDFFWQEPTFKYVSEDGRVALETRSPASTSTCSLASTATRLSPRFRSLGWKSSTCR